MVCLKFSRLVLIWLLPTVACAAGGAPTNTAPTLHSFELRDQYDLAHRISFPATNVTVMTVADRKGSDQIPDWIAPLKPRYGERLVIEGIADMSQVPRPLRMLVREHFKRRCAYPVMLDWDGPTAGSFHYRREEANLFVIDQHGRIVSHFHGVANDAALGSLFLILDRALSTPAKAPD